VSPVRTRFEKGEIVWVTYLDIKELPEKLEYIGMATATGECWILRRPATGQLIYLQNFQSIEEIQT